MQIAKYLHVLYFKKKSLFKITTKRNFVKKMQIGLFHVKIQYNNKIKALFFLYISCFYVKVKSKIFTNINYLHYTCKKKKNTTFFSENMH